MRDHVRARGLLLSIVVVAVLAGMSIVATGSVAAQQVDVAASDLSGEGTQDDPYIITNASELQAMEDNLDAHYTLNNDIDASGTAQWNNRSGFDPIGGKPYNDDTAPAFNGSLDGNSHKITDLTINRSDENQVGLYRGIKFATITQLSLVDVNVDGSNKVGSLVGKDGYKSKINNIFISGSIDGSNTVGGLIGQTYLGTIQNTETSVTVSGDLSTGGLVGKSLSNAAGEEGTIKDVTATGTVTGDDVVGGLIGRNNALIRTAAVSVDVEATGGTAGGLVGDNFGTIQNAQTSGNVTGEPFKSGGLAGINIGTIRDADASGNVKGSTSVGGLVGDNRGTIRNVVATGDVLGTDSVGGLVGDSSLSEDPNTTIEVAAATGNVTGTGNVGGLLGVTGENITIQNTVAVGEVEGSDSVGGLIGEHGGTVRKSFTAGSVNGDSSVGGMIGSILTTGQSTESYFDEQVTGQSLSAGNATGLTTAEMTGQAAETNLTGLEFGTVWETQPNDYPFLISITSDDDSDTGILAVENLSVPPTVSQGENISINATINNTGKTSLTQNITYSYSYTAGDNAQAGAGKPVKTATVAGGSEQQVSALFTVPSDAESITVEIASEDDTASMTRSVETDSDGNDVVIAPDDENPPTINDAELLNDTVTPGENIVIEINATDASDIIVGSATFRKSQGMPYRFNDGSERIEKEKFDRTGLTKERIRFELPVTEKVVNGTYDLNNIRLIDAAGNEDYIPSYDEDFLDLSVTVSNPELDPETTRPNISDVEVLNNTVQPGEQLSIDVTASDQSRITNVYARLSEQNTSYDFPFNNDIYIKSDVDDIVQNGTTRLSVNIPKSQFTGTYKIEEIGVVDQVGNFNDSTSSEKITVVNGVNRSDNTDPKINNITIPESVVAGNNVTVGINASDESRIVSATVELEPESFSPYQLPDSLQSKAEINLQRRDNAGLRNTIQFETAIPQDQFNGTYEIDTLTVKDSARNQYSAGFDPQFDETVTVRGGISNNLSKIDTNRPKVSNITIESTSLQTQEDLLGSVDVTDESTVEMVSASYRRIRSGLPEGYSPSERIELTNTSTITSGGTVNLSTSIPENTISGEYRLISVEATDALGNEGYLDSISPLTRISVEGQEPPTSNGADITSVELLNDSVAPGESAVLKIRTNNPVSIGELFLGFDPVPTDPNPGLAPAIPSNSYDDDDFKIAETGSNTTTVIMPVPETSPEGRVQLTSVASETPQLSYDPVRQTLEIASTNNTDDGTSSDTENATGSASGEDVTVAPGENTTIEFSVTNTGDINSSYLLNLSVPDELTSVAYTNASGTLQDGESKWLWETIKPGQTVRPTVTVRASPEATGSYPITVEVLTDEGVVAETNTTVTITENPDFEVTGLTTPGSVSVDTPFTYTAEVTNTGDEPGTQTVEARFDGELVGAREVTLNASEQTTLAFTTKAATAGEATVSVETANETRQATVDVVGQEFIRGQSTGDPHITTYGGVSYDFMAAGDFVLATEPQGNLHVVARQAPVGDSISNNNATATTVGDARVVIDAEATTPVSINGSAVSIADGENEIVDNGAGEISRQGSTYTVYYAGEDGDVTATDEHLTVDVVGDRLDLELALHPDRNRSVEGLLGNTTTAATSDIAFDNGTALAQPVDKELLYEEFRSDWRATGEANLFTDSFYIDTFPERFVTVDDLTAEQRSRAEALLADTGLIEGTPQYRDALIDVALTGDSSYIASAQKVSRTNVSEADSALSIPEAIDTNDNNEIDDQEILAAIEYWQTRDVVPGTDGERIGDFEILDLISQWRYNNEI